MKNRYYFRLIRVFTLIVLSIFIFVSCIYDNDDNQKMTQSIKNNEEIDNAKNTDINTEFVKYIFNNDEEYVFEYKNSDKRFMSESCFIEFYQKESEFEIKEPLGYSGIAGENGKIQYILKLKEENPKIGCNIDGNGSISSTTIQYDVGYKKYEIINNERIYISDNNEIILGAVMFSKNNSIQFDKHKLLSNIIDDRKLEYSKFDFGFILKFKLSEQKFR